MSVIMVTTQEHINQFLSKNDKIVLDFFVWWKCPIQTINTIKQLASSHKDVIFLLVNSEESFDLLQTFSICSLPTIIFMHRGVEEKRIKGASIDDLSNLLSNEYFC
ncbi:thioredoxin, putative [Entamoeba histolytica HM-1:IMSS-B]|uniref:Thioredoxin, putative n=5 Tax=Entamoeba histolytica TaxID=5759 RepID=C4M9D0_ENTH1|nr:thioredoxin, putative [Entamoeba histolytica HM-1:IMSS]EAL44410.1 thioredoxin, putative [Entamoeba histolytica HM-1:IMSS]EMH77261.1 thioredoxin, putative [Entamoeba histolytica HM-1:IMSS-B]ENY64291.1 thioredoxin, putative [Entamoeba histolytica HM-1:IMSS-A]GAT98265.1 thioredoxin putative [Entamoeba histolytica]|eukprot:XP_649796.1 thioredoxin, putative [Entamoeba histolytica HM-1:IMSS]